MNTAIKGSDSIIRGGSQRMMESDPFIAWLHEGWRLARTAPGACKSPEDLVELECEWSDARVPGTVASALHEYPRLYERFAALVRLRAVDVDLAPLKLVADAFLIGRWLTVEPFEE